MQDLNFIIDDKNAILRRKLLNELMVPLKLWAVGDLLFEHRQRDWSIITKTDSSIRFFQWRVEHIVRCSCSEADSQLTGVQFVPSVQSFMNPSKYVPSFCVSFDNFKQICDYLKLRDLNDRDKCLIRMCKFTSSRSLVRVLGTCRHSESNGHVLCYIVSYIPRVAKICNHVLFRRQSTLK